MMPLCRRAFSRPLYAVMLSALSVSACFGTGVSEASALRAAAIEHALAVNDLTLVPPAPAQAPLSWTNTGGSSLEIINIGIPPLARTSLKPTSCPGFPILVAQSSCVMQATAATDAIPGAYPVEVTYRQDNALATAHFTLTVKPGLLRINDGAPVRLSAQTSVVPVNVVNDGFDIPELQLDVHCPTADGGHAACTMDPNDCRGGLLANAGCTALLVFDEPIAGQAGVVNASGAGAVNCSVPLSVGSLAVKSLAVSAPGIYQVTLINQGTVPLSVENLQISAPGVRDMAVPTAGKPYSSCQDFLKSCTVPLRVGPDAVLGDDGLGVIQVQYRDAVTQQTATGVMRLDNSTTVQVSHALPTILASGPGSQGVLATNMGPFVWHDAGLAVGPSLPGVKLSSDCVTEILVGQDYTATVTSIAVAPEASVTALKALGKNLAAHASEPLRIARSMVATGKDIGGQASVIVSTDDGNSWVSHAMGAANGSWHTASLTAAQWTVVGDQGGQHAAAFSHDRGNAWEFATMASPATGTLRAMAQAGNTVAAFGDDGAQGVMRISTDGGTTFGAPTSDPAFSAGTIYGAASSSTTWVVVGGDGSQYFLASSNDGLVTWNGGQSGAGSLYDVAWDGQRWLAVGQDGAGDPLMLVNASSAANPALWMPVTATTSGTGTFYGVAQDGNQWLVVGDEGTMRMTVRSQDMSVPAFAAPQLLGLGSYYAVTRHDDLAYAVGYDGTKKVLVIDALDQGLRAKTAEFTQLQALYGIVSR